MAESNQEAAHKLQEEGAKLLSDVKCLYRTSQKAIDRVIEGIDAMTDLNIEVIKNQLQEKLGHEDGYLFLRQINDVLDSLRGQSFFQGLKTSKALDAYMANTSTVHCEEKLMQVILDSHYVAADNGKPVLVPKDYGYYIPFLPQLEQLLNCSEVLDFVLNPKPAPSGVYRSVTDGLFYKHHFIVKRFGNQVLAIIIYCDDVEFADPCKSKTKKHRLRLYYWSLGNIPPEFRSTLKAINLLAIVKTSMAKKYGNEPFLEDFMLDIIKLGTGGVTFKILGIERILHGILVCSCGDMPAQANLAGFKESHLALRPCRHCMVLNSKLCDSFIEDTNLIRSKTSHDGYLKEIDNYVPSTKKRKVAVPVFDVPEEDTDEPMEDLQQDTTSKQFQNHENPSINYGINRSSVLSLAPGFDCCKCFPVDIMHTLHEGLVNDLCRFLIKDLCFPQKVHAVQPKPKYSLSFLNEYLKDRCDFGHLNVNKPSVIEKGHLDNKLRQSAAQMYVLAHILPFFTLNNIPVEKHQLLLLLLKILDQTMSFEIKEDDIKKLEKLVEEFGTKCVTLYPTFKTLKLHSLRHLGMTARLFGGFRQVWCFRYEAMHRLFTSLVDVVNNMKNIELSMASRYILRRDTEFLKGRNGNFLYKGDTLSGCETLKKNDVPKDDLIILQSLFDIKEETQIKIAKSMTKHGSCWTENSVFIECYNDNGDASFGKLKNIYLVDNEVTFLYSTVKTKYVEDLNSYSILGYCNNITAQKFALISPPPCPVARFCMNFKGRSASSLIVVKLMDVEGGESSNS